MELRALLHSPSSPNVHQISLYSFSNLRVAWPSTNISNTFCAPTTSNRQFYFWKLNIYISVQKYRLQQHLRGAISSRETETIQMPISI